jgi:hypothetical protein
MENHVTKFAFVHELTAFWTLEEVLFRQEEPVRIRRLSLAIGVTHSSRGLAGFSDLVL